MSISGVNGDPMPYQTANIPITLRGKTVWETVAVAPEEQLNAKVLLSVPMDTNITDKLLENYFHKQQEDDKKIQVNAITRSSTADTPAVKYFPTLQRAKLKMTEHQIYLIKLAQIATCLIVRQQWSPMKTCQKSPTRPYVNA